MKQKRYLSLFLALIFLLTCFPVTSAHADELADGQIIANGIYYIQSVYSNYYMQVTEGLTLNNTYISHMDKNIEVLQSVMVVAPKYSKTESVMKPTHESHDYNSVRECPI